MSTPTMFSRRNGVIKYQCLECGCAVGNMNSMAEFSGTSHIMLCYGHPRSK